MGRVVVCGGGKLRWSETRGEGEEQRVWLWPTARMKLTSECSWHNLGRFRMLQISAKICKSVSNEIMNITTY